jgi:hypothetical protein
MALDLRGPYVVARSQRGGRADSDAERDRSDRQLPGSRARLDRPARLSSAQAAARLERHRALPAGYLEIGSFSWLLSAMSVLVLHRWTDAVLDGAPSIDHSCCVSWGGVSLIPPTPAKERWQHRRQDHMWRRAPPDIGALVGLAHVAGRSHEGRRTIELPEKGSTGPGRPRRPLRSPRPPSSVPG